MRNYFDFDDRPINDDTIDREENRSRFYLSEALEYDRKYINRILNKSELLDADRFNISSVVSLLSFEFEDSAKTSKEFEEFLIEVNGKEWYDNMSRAFMQRKMNEFALNVGAPEMFNGRGMYLFNMGESDEEDED